jgi:monoamine oxidase
VSRRRFLELGATAGIIASLPGSACSPKHPQWSGGPRIAIVGAGIAGLTCAYRLAQGGLGAKVFDSWNRVGGRMFTARDRWADQQLTELGGELIDTKHAALRALADELGLTLDAIVEPSGNGVRQDTWFFDGRLVADAELVEAFRPVAPRLGADAAREDDAPEFARIDRLGLAAYLDSIPELEPVLRALIEVAYVGEYGLEPERQSPWNLLWLIDSATPEPFRVYGDSDEAYHVHGGNDQIPAGLAARLSHPIELEHRLVKVVERASGAFGLSFERPGRSALEQDFDYVVFALPFTRLREVELLASMPRLKLDMIQQLGMGTNAKLMGQFSERVWRTRHLASGSVTTDNGLQLLWETSRGQAGRAGILTVFAGGSVGERLGDDTAEAQMTARLARLDAIFPGTSAQYVPGSAVRMHWPTVEHTKGSYSCYLPGQARFSGHEGEAVGRLRFCGEHTSADFQGFMNGGAETGEGVARQLLAELGVTRHGSRRIERAVAVG